MSGDTSSIFFENKQCTVVPWYNKAEFLKVYEYLYSDDILKKKWACDAISEWEARCYPSLPAAIEASYLLTCATIQDSYWTNEASISRYSDIQSSYGSAVSRFVSLIVEAHQNFSFQRPNAVVARELGISSDIVRIRNEFSHAHRPALSLLRRAAHDALDYLKQSYWKKEASQIENHVKRVPSDNSKIQRLLNEYMAARLDAIRLAANNAEVPNSKTKSLSLLLAAIRGLLIKNKKLFIDILVLDGNFIPDLEDFKQIVKAQTFSEYVSEIEEYDFDEDTFRIALAFKKAFPTKIPKIHEKLWTPVIFELNRADAVPIFVEALLRTQRDRNIVGQKLIIAWVSKILLIRINSDGVDACDLKRIFNRKGIVMNWRRLFYSAVMNPTKYTPFLLPILLFHLNWDMGLKNHMLNMIAIYLGQMKDKGTKPAKKSKFFTIEELKLAKKQQKLQRMKESGVPVEECIWTKCLDEELKSVNVGFILNAIDDTEIEEESEDDEDEDFDDEMDEKFSKSNENDKKDIEMIDGPDTILPDPEDIRNVFLMKRADRH